MDVMLPHIETPSFRDRVHSVPRSNREQRGMPLTTPINSSASRSTSFVRSGLIVQVSPRSRDVKNRLPPACRMRGLWGERRNGVFQFHRIAASNGGAGAMFVSVGSSSSGTRGVMGRETPSRRSTRRRRPFWDSTNTIAGSVGSTCV